MCGREHTCMNTEGTYVCNCGPGYQKGENERTCIDIDECRAHEQDASLRQPCSDGICINFPGGFSCQCPDGFRLGRGARCYGKYGCSMCCQEDNGLLLEDVNSGRLWPIEQVCIR
ncbi:unnamed protein product [Protopolystoma xenopodis]|uniref:EGF-like domain-containing protein n=1 Tax=Protopolystoma xenopodis TaxID=117903 RepID=A0A3S5CP05_9PLAT|nr:unnamed protein product [Protopolystoma xenopodis]